MSSKKTSKRRDWKERLEIFEKALAVLEKVWPIVKTAIKLLAPIVESNL
ncbi:MAG: hypothetical protein ABMA02_05575 [Saprospiraceae bacterium]